jgi:tripartite-type tricarboxylate transporter receptor subunit TctC
MRRFHATPFHRLKLLACLALALAFLAQPARADFPDRTVRIIVPFPAGGTIDITARHLASLLNAKWNVPVIVENRPGAGNTVGATAVAQSAPDGYTLLFANTSVSVNPSLFKSLPYDTERDLTPVIFLSHSPNVLLVQKSLGVNTLKELLELAKSRGKPLTYASVGKGSFHHISMELLQSEAKIELLHIPHRGVAPAMLAFVRGDVDLYCSDLPGAIPQIRAGEVKAIAVTSGKRARTLPDIPSMAEAGLPGYDISGYVGIMAPAGTPREIIDKINQAFNEVIGDKEFHTRFADLGYEMTGGTVQEFATFLKNDIARYARVLKAAGITPE